MTVAATTYWIGFAALNIFIIIAAILLRRYAAVPNLQAYATLLILAIMFTNKWIFPYVYTVPQCGQVIKEILLYPKPTGQGTPLALGKHCYLVNEATTNVRIETIYYGDESPEKSPDKVINDVVKPLSAKQFNVVDFDYFFEDAERNVQTKQGGELKYQVSCVR